jgi:hypothetical protein
MSGFLDSKTRILDTVVTSEGRRQITQGKLRISHVSFTDGGTFYAADVVSGSSDATLRPMLEASDLPQDQITFEADDSGRLVPFRSAGAVRVRAGQLVSYQTVSGAYGFVETSVVLSGSDAADQQAVLLDESLVSFQRQLMLGTRDALFEDDGFAAGPSTVTFTIDDRGPIKDSSLQRASLDRMESLFQDPRLSHLPNFRYLPPVNHVRVAESRSSPLGNYRPWGRVGRMTYDELATELKRVELSGGSRSIRFDPTSRTNRIVCQLFERAPSGLRKLDVIDFGVHATGDPTSPSIRVLFAGKLMTDSAGTDTFLHLFTLVFE